MVAAVRDARDDEAGSIADLLSRAAFGPSRLTTNNSGHVPRGWSRCGYF